MRPHPECKVEHAICAPCDGTGEGYRKDVACAICDGSGSVPCLACDDLRDRDAVRVAEFRAGRAAS